MAEAHASSDSTGIGGVIVLLVQVLVVLALPVVAVGGWAAWQLGPDSIDLAPLTEVSENLDTVLAPKEYCPESADSCWGSVVLASSNGDDPGTVVANDAAAVGFVEYEDPFGPWAAQRGGECLSLYERAMGSGVRGTPPAGSIEVRLDRC